MKKEIKSHPPFRSRKKRYNHSHNVVITIASNAAYKFHFFCIITMLLSIKFCTAAWFISAIFFWSTNLPWTTTHLLLLLILILSHSLYWNSKWMKRWNRLLFSPHYLFCFLHAPTDPHNISEDMGMQTQTRTYIHTHRHKVQRKIENKSGEKKKINVILVRRRLSILIRIFFQSQCIESVDAFCVHCSGAVHVDEREKYQCNNEGEKS